MSTHTTGSVARGAGVGVETIRFYEREGLIGKPPRTPSGYRQYPEDVIERVRFIQRAKDLGFSLAEIRELLALSVRPGSECDDVRLRAEAKIADIEARMRDLDAMRRVLAELTRACATGKPTSECPILECLSRGGEILRPLEGKHREMM